MLRKKINHPDKTVSTGAYSDGILCGDWLYISGQGALNLTTGQIAADSIEDQVRITMDHIGKILRTAGCTFDDIVKCTCHLSDIKDFDRFDRTYSEYFKSDRPARTTVQSRLGDGMKVEIDAIARKP